MNTLSAPTSLLLKTCESQYMCMHDKCHVWAQTSQGKYNLHAKTVPVHTVAKYISHSYNVMPATNTTEVFHVVPAVKFLATMMTWRQFLKNLKSTSDLKHGKDNGI